jgi:hypothetical protein
MSGRTCVRTAPLVETPDDGRQGGEQSELRRHPYGPSTTRFRR